jgi:hypothetical protein
MHPLVAHLTIRIKISSVDHSIRVIKQAPILNFTYTCAKISHIPCQYACTSHSVFRWVLFAPFQQIRGYFAQKSGLQCTTRPWWSFLLREN